MVFCIEEPGNVDEEVTGQRIHQEVSESTEIVGGRGARARESGQNIGERTLEVGITEWEAALQGFFRNDLLTIENQ
jgi:hypothetical protein